MNRERMEQVNGGSVRWDGKEGAAKWGLTPLLALVGERIRELERKGMPRKGKPK